LCAVPLCVTWVSLKYFCWKAISLYSTYIALGFLGC
jgi:hypothetical protein